MSDTVITVSNLSKLYRIGQRERYYALRDVLSRAITAPFRRLKQIPQSGFRNPNSEIGPSSTLTSTSASSRSDEIWALKDVSFKVKQGEVVGIIGRNGAGKTTLLKILSRITEPTEGCAEIRGRVGSLLEVGTGFHAELTGRENIFLNGAILGMKKSEIERKFDEIVAFAEVEKFIDTPVKHYSSGMYVRLAFAVAAHLEPEILLVDEVLAVGDAQFQKKCLGKMGDVGREGRTVLFVSHNMAAITRLCPRTVLLDVGKVLRDGPSHQVVNTYLGSGLRTTAAGEWPNLNEAPGDDVVRLKAIRIRDRVGNMVNIIDIREPVGIEVEYWNLSTTHSPSVGIHLWNAEGVQLFASHDFNNKKWYNTTTRPLGLIKAICWIPGNFLAEGKFIVTMTISSFSPTLLHHVVEYEVVSFEICDNSKEDGVRGPTCGAWPGVLRPLLEWHIEAQPKAL